MTNSCVSCINFFFQLPMMEQLQDLYDGTNLCGRCCTVVRLSRHFSTNAFTWRCHLCCLTTGFFHSNCNCSCALLLLSVWGLWVLSVASVVVVVIIWNNKYCLPRISVKESEMMKTIWWGLLYMQHTCFCPHMFLCLSLRFNFLFLLLLPFMNFCTQLVNLIQKRLCVFIQLVFQKQQLKWHEANSWITLDL